MLPILGAANTRLHALAADGVLSHKQCKSAAEPLVAGKSKSHYDGGNLRYNLNLISAYNSGGPYDMGLGHRLAATLQQSGAASKRALMARLRSDDAAAFALISGDLLGEASDQARCSTSLCCSVMLD